MEELEESDDLNVLGDFGFGNWVILDLELDDLDALGDLNWGGIKRMI